MKKIKTGNHVRIKTITHTSNIHGLDSNGDMESMVGKVFKVESTSGNRVYISKSQGAFQYTWNIEDIVTIEDEVLDPKIFEFDVNQLV